MVAGLLWLDTCSSTNDEAAERLDQPDLRGVAADHQTAGRGRLGRRWISAPGCGLYLSWIARPKFNQSSGGQIPLLAAVAVAEELDARGARPTLKWPNDILLGRDKLGGILCETRGAADAWTAIVGIGINLRSPPGGFGAFSATTLASRLDPPPDPRALAGALLRRLEAWLKIANQEGMAPIRDAWHSFGPPLGTRMRRGDVEGAFLGLATDGALRLQVGTDETRIHVGDVVLVDPPGDA